MAKSGTSTYCYVIEDEHGELIKELANRHGVSASVIMRNILGRWDKQYVVMPEEKKRGKQ